MTKKKQIFDSKNKRNRKKVIFATSLRGRAVVARRAHNPEAVGSNPAPATKGILTICI